MDISAAVALNFSKFGKCGPKVHMKGSVSQIFNLGPRFHFMRTHIENFRLIT